MKVFIYSLLLLLSISCVAQKPTNPDKVKVDFNRFWSKTFTLPAPDTIFTPGFPIGDVKVIDRRFDTTTLGFMQKGFPDTRRILKLKNGTTAGIRNYIISSLPELHSDSALLSYQLICNIKKLWLSDEIYTTEQDDEHRNSPKQNAPKESGIILRLEFVLKSNDQYIPLCRFDTTITGEHPIYRDGDQYISHSLAASLQKLSTQSSGNTIAIKKKFNGNEINNYHASRFNIPILTEKTRKGVYLTFEAFRNNSPSIKNYRVSSDKKSDYLYTINEAGQETLIRDIYGYSDGEDIFLYSAGNFFRLYRTGNTFNMYGAKSLKKIRQYITTEKILLMGLNPETFSKNNTKVSYELKLHPYQLDMETGVLY